jgi:uncharacterized protein YbjT (DUF2867 family)
MSSTGEGLILVVGGTGHLGASVVTALRARGKRVRALVRPGSDASALERSGVEISRGDMLDVPSLERAFAGASAVITSAIGYSNRKRGDQRSATDERGNLNLIAAARAAGLRRFVLTSILTCNRAPRVPHFRAKALVEERLAASGIPFVALRPGAFIQASDFWISGLRKGRLEVFGDPDVRWSYIHTSDLARYLALAVDLPENAAAIIDIGCDRAVSPREIAAIMTAKLGRPIRVRALPWPLAYAMLSVGGLVNPWLPDLRNMFAYILEGGYVADTANQRRWFGDVPRIEDSLHRYLTERQL